MGTTVMVDPTTIQLGPDNPAYFVCEASTTPTPSRLQVSTGVLIRSRFGSNTSVGIWIRFVYTCKVGTPPSTTGSKWTGGGRGEILSAIFRWRNRNARHREEHISLAKRGREQDGA